MDWGYAMTSKKLAEAMSLSAFLAEADNAGYLGHEDTLTVQKIKVDLAKICQSIALDLLKSPANLPQAKVILLSNIAQFRSSIARIGYEEDDKAIFAYLENSLNEALEKEASRSDAIRAFSRALLFLPSFFRWILLAIVALGLAFAINDVFAR